MNTTYDDVWETLENIIGIGRELLPNTDEERYLEIHNAVRQYNTHTDNLISLEYNDDLELFSEKLGDNNILLIALYIKRNILQSKLEYFEAVHIYSMSQVTTKFYKEQVSARESAIARVDKQINQIIADEKDGDFN